MFSFHEIQHDIWIMYSELSTLPRYLYEYHGVVTKTTKQTELHEILFVSKCYRIGEICYLFVLLELFRYWNADSVIARPNAPDYVFVSFVSFPFFFSFVLSPHRAVFAFCVSSRVYLDQRL